MNDWFYTKNGEQAGPVSFEDLRALFAAGSLGQAELVWREGMTEWMEASRINGLIPVKTSVPPPLPASLETHRLLKAPTPPNQSLGKQGHIDKTCCVCRIDVSRVKRTKDTDGHYYCRACWLAKAKRDLPTQHTSRDNSSSTDTAVQSPPIAPSQSAADDFPQSELATAVARSRQEAPRRQPAFGNKTPPRKRYPLIIALAVILTALGIPFGIVVHSHLNPSTTPTPTLGISDDLAGQAISSSTALQGNRVSNSEPSTANNPVQTLSNASSDPRTPSSDAEIERERAAVAISIKALKDEEKAIINRIESSYAMLPAKINARIALIERNAELPDYNVACLLSDEAVAAYRRLGLSDTDISRYCLLSPYDITRLRQYGWTLQQMLTWWGLPPDKVKQAQELGFTDDNEVADLVKEQLNEPYSKAFDTYRTIRDRIRQNTSQDEWNVRLRQIERDSFFGDDEEYNAAQLLKEEQSPRKIYNITDADLDKECDFEEIRFDIASLDGGEAGEIYRPDGYDETYTWNSKSKLAKLLMSVDQRKKQALASVRESFKVKQDRLEAMLESKIEIMEDEIAAAKNAAEAKASANQDSSETRIDDPEIWYDQAYQQGKRIASLYSPNTSRTAALDKLNRLFVTYIDKKNQLERNAEYLRSISGGYPPNVANADNITLSHHRGMYEGMRDGLREIGIVE